MGSECGGCDGRGYHHASATSDRRLNTSKTENKIDGMSISRLWLSLLAFAAAGRVDLTWAARQLPRVSRMDPDLATSLGPSTPMFQRQRCLLTHHSPRPEISLDAQRCQFLSFLRFPIRCFLLSH